VAKKQRKVEQKYAVSISLKAWDITRAGSAIKLKVRDRDGVLGTVEIGQGTFGWKGARGKTFKRISWGQLANDLERY
jgi:hypothetical protein